MSISASMVKELRERTGAGMMECKKALQESNGNIDSAIELLRTSGQAKAEKKAKRLAKEGPKQEETKIKPLDPNKPISLDFLTNPNKE